MYTMTAHVVMAYVRTACAARTHAMTMDVARAHATTAYARAVTTHAAVDSIQLLSFD